MRGRVFRSEDRFPGWGRYRFNTNLSSLTTLNSPGPFTVIKFLVRALRPPLEKILNSGDPGERLPHAYPANRPGAMTVAELAAARRNQVPLGIAYMVGST